MHSRPKLLTVYVVMTEQEREDLLKLKLIYPEIKNSMQKILDNQEVLTELRLEADDNKQFRIAFEDRVLSLVARRLNTIEFEKSLNKQIKEQVEHYLSTETIRKDFYDKVDKRFTTLFKEKQLGLYVKLTTIVGTLVLAIITFIAQGFIDGK